MRSHFLNYTLVGLFVTAMVAALIWAVASISGRTGPTDSYSIVMDNVTDIDFGTLVRYEGYKVGQIEVIVPEWNQDKYRFRVVVSVRQGWRIPKDSIARIAASSFLAAKTVEIYAGKSSELVALGGDIQSGPPADVFSLVASVAADIGDLSENSLKPLVAKVSDIIGRLGTKTEANLDELFQSLNAIADEIEAKTPGITADIEEIADKTKVDLDQVKKFVSDGNAEAVEHILANLEQASKDATKVSADVKQVSAKIKELADEAKAILAENRGNVGSSVENLEYILRSVSQNIDSLTHNLDGTARNLNEFSRLIRQQPGLLLSGGTPQVDTGLSPSSDTGQDAR